MNSSERFVENEFSLNQHKEEKTNYKTYEEHKQALIKCIASTLDGFIIKIRNEFDISYIQIKRSKINDYFGFNIT